MNPRAFKINKVNAHATSCMCILSCIWLQSCTPASCPASISLSTQSAWLSLLAVAAICLRPKPLPCPRPRFLCALPVAGSDTPSPGAEWPQWLVLVRLIAPLLLLPYCSPGVLCWSASVTTVRTVSRWLASSAGLPAACWDLPVHPEACAV